ncbi:MAG: DUF4405 domain-containing protein [Verrucomicrobiota bacterium]
MMRHLVNFGLLFSFLTLAVTGVLAFARPFSIVTTRIHIVFGLVTLILVGLHLSSPLPYFRQQLKPTGGRVSRPLLAAIALVWVVLLAIAFVGWNPARLLIDQSYEARNQAAIVRVSSLAAFSEQSENQRLVTRQPAREGDASVSLSVGFNQALETFPAIAVWAETTPGAMIETLYLDPTLAYSDEPTWAGEKTPRHHILPLWRHRYSLVSGVDPTGEVDALSGATNSHSFTLDNYLTLGEEKSFVLCVEVNAAGDANEKYPDPHIGQPSLLYTALIDLDSEQRYALLELTGHGGGAEKSGAIQYDLDGFDTAKNLIDVLLAKAGLQAR